MIDVLITSASRPDLLKRTVESFLAMSKTKEKFNFILHEDVVRKEDSSGVLEWVDSSNLFSKVCITYPASRLGLSVYKMLPEIKTDFFVKLEDDWEFLKLIPIDAIIRVMQEDKKINQVCFNQDENRNSKHGFLLPQFDKGEIWLTLVQEFVVGVGVFRTRFMKDIWQPFEDANLNIGRLANMSTYNKEELVDKLGAYFLGGHGDPPFIKHIGGDGRSSWFAPIEGKDY